MSMVYVDGGLLRLMDDLSIKETYHPICSKICKGGYDAKIISETEQKYHDTFYIKINRLTQSSKQDVHDDNNDPEPTNWLAIKMDERKKRNSFFKKCVNEYNNENQPVDVYYYDMNKSYSG